MDQKTKIEQFIDKTGATLELIVKPHHATAMLYDENDLSITSFKGMNVNDAISKAVDKYNERGSNGSSKPRMLK